MDGKIRGVLFSLALCVVLGALCVAHAIRGNATGAALLGFSSGLELGFVMWKASDG